MSRFGVGTSLTRARDLAYLQSRMVVWFYEVKKYFLHSISIEQTRAVHVSDFCARRKTDFRTYVLNKKKSISRVNSKTFVKGSTTALTRAPFTWRTTAMRADKMAKLRRTRANLNLYWKFHQNQNLEREIPTQTWSLLSWGWNPMWVNVSSRYGSNFWVLIRQDENSMHLFIPCYLTSQSS